MIEPTNIYVYKMIADNGGAPCVHLNLLSLSLCKPKVRRTAERGALVFGFGGHRLGGRLIFAARVTDKPAVGDYYRKPDYRGRPDCIYRDVGGRPKRIKGAQFHALTDQSVTDVGVHFEKAYVLLSDDFRYFGAAGTTDYQERFTALSTMLRSLRRGHRLNHDWNLQEELCLLAFKLWRDFPKGKNGEPSDADHSRRCNTEPASVSCF